MFELPLFWVLWVLCGVLTMFFFDAFQTVLWNYTIHMGYRKGAYKNNKWFTWSRIFWSVLLGTLGGFPFAVLLAISCVSLIVQMYIRGIETVMTEICQN